MRSNYAVHLELEQESEQEAQRRLRKQNMQTIKEETETKQDRNSEFWRKAWWVANVIALIIIAATIFRFSQ